MYVLGHFSPLSVRVIIPQNKKIKKTDLWWLLAHYDMARSIEDGVVLTRDTKGEERVKVTYSSLYMYFCVICVDHFIPFLGL